MKHKPGVITEPAIYLLADVSLLLRTQFLQPVGPDFIEVGLYARLQGLVLPDGSCTKGAACKLIWSQCPPAAHRSQHRYWQVSTVTGRETQNWSDHLSVKECHIYFFFYQYNKLLFFFFFTCQVLSLFPSGSTPSSLRHLHPPPP